MSSPSTERGRADMRQELQDWARRHLPLPPPPPSRGWDSSARRRFQPAHLQGDGLDAPHLQELAAIMRAGSGELTPQEEEQLQPGDFIYAMI